MQQYYTIGDVSRITQIPATTIRFYDKKGLLFFVNRSSNGVRIFTNKDLSLIFRIRYLRDIGVSVNEILEFMSLAVRGGEHSLKKQSEMLGEYQKALDERMKLLHSQMYYCSLMDSYLKENKEFPILKFYKEMGFKL